MKRLLTVALVAVLAGCGGGGGGGATGGSPLAPVPTPAAPAVPSTAVQRTLVQQSLSSAQQGGIIATFGGSSTTTAMSVARRVAMGERMVKSVVGCTNGVVSTVTPGVNANITIIETKSYYDLACTQIESDINLTLTVTSSTAASATGNATSFTQAGTVSSYQVIALTITSLSATSGTFSIRDDVAPNQTATAVANLGIGCSIATASATCSVAAAEHLASLNLDNAASATVTGNLTRAASGLENVALTGSGSAVSGALNTTNVAPTGAYLWAITGGTVVDSATITGALQYNAAGVVAGGTLALTDATDNASVAESYNPATQSLSGTIAQTSTGKPIATFTVNGLGSGTVTYADGSTASIANWVVAG